MVRFLQRRRTAQAGGGGFVNRGRPAIGPLAAGIAGDMYRRLSEQKYFAASQPITAATLVSRQVCCAK